MIQNQKIIRATRAASAIAAAATKDLIIMKEIINMTEDVTGTVLGLVIAATMIPGGDTGTLAKAIAGRSLAIKQGAILQSSLGSLFDRFEKAKDSISRNSR